MFITLEASKGDEQFGRIVAAYRASDMSFVGSAELIDNIDDRAPWCFVNPRNGLLYTTTLSEEI
jgi:hypothetical protein